MKLLQLAVELYQLCVSVRRRGGWSGMGLAEAGWDNGCGALRPQIRRCYDILERCELNSSLCRYNAGTSPPNP
jgi:hypothetical protein